MRKDCESGGWSDVNHFILKRPHFLNSCVHVMVVASYRCTCVVSRRFFNKTLIFSCVKAKSKGLLKSVIIRSAGVVGNIRNRVEVILSVGVGIDEEGMRGHEVEEGTRDGRLHRLLWI